MRKDNGDPEEDTDLDDIEYDGWTSPEIEEYNDDEWVEDDDGNFVKADETKKNKSKKSK